MEYVLGADIGSGSVKLTLLAKDGTITADAQCEYPTAHPYVGWCEQDPEDWCRAFQTALKLLLQKAGISPQQIKAVAPDAATHTAVLLDKDRKVLRPAILWTDQRSIKQVNKLRQEHLSLIQAQTLNVPTTVWTLPQLMWLQENEPAVWGQIRHILFAKDYLRQRLTGSPEADVTDLIDAAGSMFYDVIAQSWSAELCEIGQIDRKWLPRVCQPSDLFGSVSLSAAEEFGLAPGTKVLVGTTDTAVELLAAGSTQPGHTTVKLATAGRICVISPSKLNSEFIFNYRYLEQGLWYPGTGTASCANSYRWYRDTLGNRSYGEMNEAAAQVPPGSQGLLFHPYLNGELTPYNDPNLRGSYVGISAAHTQAHFTRATLEGVAFSLRECLNTLRALHVEMSRVRVIGGGAKGTLWRQIVADVLGLTLEKVQVDDSSFGSAMVAAVGIGWYDSFTQAAEACVKIDSVCTPIPENEPVYDQLFQRYKAVHDALAPIYHSES
jgi:xylulokinase